MNIYRVLRFKKPLVREHSKVPSRGGQGWVRVGATLAVARPRAARRN